MAERVWERESERPGESERERVRNVIGTASTSLLAAKNRHYAEIIIPIGEEREKLSQKRVNARVRRSLRCVLHFVG